MSDHPRYEDGHPVTQEGWDALVAEYEALQECLDAANTKVYHLENDTGKDAEIERAFAAAERDSENVGIKTTERTPVTIERTERGFGVFGRVTEHGGGTIVIQESSLAFEGPHVWLFHKGVECSEHLGEHFTPSPQLNLEQARELRDALDAFITAAERGECTEPVEEKS